MLHAVHGEQAVQTEHAVHVHPQVTPLHGVHTPQEFAPHVWMVQSQACVKAQPWVFSTQSSVTSPQLVMSSQPPPLPPPILIKRSRTRNRGMALLHANDFPYSATQGYAADVEWSMPARNARNGCIGPRRVSKA
jgi:hypothetical protein